MLVSPLQAETDQAPQILTSDLTRKQIINYPAKVVTFVFVDDDLIKEVIINDQLQTFEPDKTIVIVKKFRFQKGKTLIKVSVTDEKGNQRQKTYLVGFGVQLDVKPKNKIKEASKLFWKLLFGISAESDSNPTNDLSAPYGIDSFPPEFRESLEADQKRTLKGILVLGYDKYNGMLGVVRGVYANPNNNILNSSVGFLNMGYKNPINDDWKAFVNFGYMEIKLGDFEYGHLFVPSAVGFDYSKNYTLSGGGEYAYKDKGGDFKKHSLTLELLYKDFAVAATTGGSSESASNAKNNGMFNLIRWDYFSLDKEKQDSYKSAVSVGVSSEGTEESEFNFISADFDWANKWGNGLFWDMGVGVQKRAYLTAEPLLSTTKLGSLRVDLPLRASSGFGWANNNYKAAVNAKHVSNYSNKQPYKRNTISLSLDGNF